MQFPPLPPTPDLQYLVHQVSPFVALIVVFVGVRWVLRSTGIGEAFAERIRQRSRGRWGVAGEDPQRVAALEEQVSQLQGQVPGADARHAELVAAVDELRREVAELAERVDFTERLLAKGRDGEAGKLGPGERRTAST